MRPVRGVRVRSGRVHLHGLRARLLAARGQEGLLPAANPPHQMGQRVRDRSGRDFVPWDRDHPRGRLSALPPQRHARGQGVGTRAHDHPIGRRPRVLLEHVPAPRVAHHCHLHTAEVRSWGQLQCCLRRALDEDQ